MKILMPILYGFLVPLLLIAIIGGFGMWIESRFNTEVMPGAIVGSCLFFGVMVLAFMIYDN